MTNNRGSDQIGNIDLVDPPGQNYKKDIVDLVTIVGMKFYNNTPASLFFNYNGESLSESVFLTADTYNKHDKNAVKVINCRGQLIGFVSATEAKRVKEQYKLYEHVILLLRFTKHAAASMVGQIISRHHCDDINTGNGMSFKKRYFKEPTISHGYNRAYTGEGYTFCDNDDELYF